MFGETPSDVEEGEEGEVEEDDRDVETAEVGKLLPSERSLIRKLRIAKVEISVRMRLFCVHKVLLLYHFYV